MKRYLGPLLLALLLAAVAHLATVYAIPRVVMAAAMDGIAGHRGVNSWLASRHRVSPATRGVVRPAPQLAYSACVYDLGDGPVHIRMAPAPGYWSLSLYGASTDNFRTWNDRNSARGVDIWLSADGDTQRPPPAGVTRVRAPSQRGIALIRRRVTSDAQWQQLQSTRRGDLCQAVPNLKANLEPQP